MNRLALALVALSMLGGVASQDAWAADITYQGQLRNAGDVFTGFADLEFRLYDQLGGGVQVGSTVSRPGWPVEDGLFQVELDFGAGVFDGTDRYIEVRVDGTPLLPRQPLNAAPIAAFALDGNEGPQGPEGPAGPQGPEGATGPQGPEGPPGPEGSQGLQGVEGPEGPQGPRGLAGPEGPQGPQGPAGPEGPQGADGPAGPEGPQGLQGAQGPQGPQGLAGPEGPQGADGASPYSLDPVTGIIEYQFDDLLVRHAPTGSSPSITQGHSSNQATSPGATVAGGGSAAFPHTASGWFSFIGGGRDNQTLADYAIVGAGNGNTASGLKSVVGGGDRNEASGENAVIAGGLLNRASGEESTVSGGQENYASGRGSSIGGGSVNRSAGVRSFVGGGLGNGAVSRASTVPGGERNCAGGAHSWAGGYGAGVRDPDESVVSTACFNTPSSGDLDGDEGSFVWADSNHVVGEMFHTTGPNQFLVRAAGGVGINTNAPASALHVVGDSPASLFDGQLTIEGRETTGDSGTGGAIAFQGHDGGTPRVWGVIRAVKENSIDRNTDSVISFYNRSFSAGLRETMRIDSDGIVYNATGSWAVFSDERLKEDIRPLDGALDRLLSLEGVTFRYRDPDSALVADGQRTGFVAQQVETVFPEWVGENAEGIKYVSPSGFEALTVEALRDLDRSRREDLALLEQRLERQQAEIAGLRYLRSENRDLAARLAALEARMVATGAERLANNP